LQAKLKSKALIYIGGAEMQLPGVLAAKAAGLYTVVTDLEANPPAARYADRFVQLSATDVEGLLALSAEIARDYTLIGAYGIAQYAYDAIGLMADRHGMRIGSSELFRVVSDKQATNAALQKNGVGVPTQRIIDVNQRDADIADMAISEFDFPLVVKPRDGHGSHGISIIATPNHTELVRAIDRARSVSDQLIFETALDGIHYNVDGLMIENEYFPVSITERHPITPGSTLTLKGFEPNDLPPETVAQLHDNGAGVARALGIQSGPVSAELLHTANGPRVFEVSSHFQCIWNTAHNGGSAIGAWFSWLAGDTEWRRHLRQDKTDVVGYYFVRSFEHDRRLISLNGVQEISRRQYVKRVIEYKKPGTLVQNPEGKGDLIYVLLLRCPDRQSFHRTAKQCVDGIDIILGQGEADDIGVTAEFSTDRGLDRPAP
jgi:hypothetical protein